MAIIERELEMKNICNVIELAMCHGVVPESEWTLD